MTEADKMLEPDDYDAMNTDQLKEALRKKDTSLNETFGINQGLVSDRRILQERLIAEEKKTTELTAKLAKEKTEFERLAREWNSALHFAASLLDKLRSLSGHYDYKDKDIKTAMRMYNAAVDHIVHIVSFPQIDQWDFFEQVFDEIDRKVFGEKNVARERSIDFTKKFIERGLQKYYRKHMTPQAIKSMKSTIEELLLRVAPAKVIPGFEVHPIPQAGSDPDKTKMVFEIIITDPEWAARVRETLGK